MKAVALAVLLGSVCCSFAKGEDAQITIETKTVLHPTNRYMVGSCMEDVNHEVYGGIYSQMIFGESFQEPPDGASAPPISQWWSPLHTGAAQGSYAVIRDTPFLGQQSQRMTFLSGQGDIGVENQGLHRWGMNYVAGKPYEGVLWVKTPQPETLVVAAESRDGSHIYAESSLTTHGGDWERLEFTLTPNAVDPAGRFSIKLRQPGSVDLGYAFLQPGAWGRFKNLPVRKDVAEGLIAEGLTVMRYGGSAVNSPEYRWKKMIGPRDRRPPYKGTWYPYVTNGWGIIDFLDFCEGAGFLSIPAFNLDETPADMADFVHYADDPPDTDWGKKRAADGHAEPYHLRVIEIGNEEAVDDNYWAKFEPIARALWAIDPHLILTVGDFAYEKPFTDPYHLEAPRIHSLAAHEKILALAKELHTEVWFDVHIGSENARDLKFAGTDSFQRALTQLSHGADFKVATYELNADTHDLRRALANAAVIGYYQRAGFHAAMISANALQPDGQNDNDWNQGLLFLNPTQVWQQPPGYVAQMLARHYLPQCVKADVTSPKNALDVTATLSQDGKTLALTVVNLELTDVPAQINLKDYAPSQPNAKIDAMSGPLDAANTAAEPLKIAPVQTEWAHQEKEGVVHYTFPANSFTIIQFE
jgi:hypothetical protein